MKLKEYLADQFVEQQSSFQPNSIEWIAAKLGYQIGFEDGVQVIHQMLSLDTKVSKDDLNKVKNFGEKEMA